MIDGKQSPYAAWQERIEDKINAITINVTKLAETQVTEAEVEAKMNTRVSLDAYSGDMRGLNERLTRIESNPQKFIAWAGVISGCLGTFLAFVSVVFGIITWAILHYK